MVVLAWLGRVLLASSFSFADAICRVSLLFFSAFAQSLLRFVFSAIVLLMVAFVAQFVFRILSSQVQW